MEHSEFVPIINEAIENESSQTATRVDNPEDSFSNLLDSPFPSIPYFSEISGSADYRASPPIGRTTTTYSHKDLLPSPLNPQQSEGSRIKVDSGFSSWVGTAESQPKFFPALMRVDSEEPEPTSGSRTLPPYVSHFNRPTADTASSSVLANLSSLPCANALNEELTDRMLVRDFGERSRDRTNGQADNRGTPFRRKERFKISPEVLRNSTNVASDMWCETNSFIFGTKHFGECPSGGDSLHMDGIPTRALLRQRPDSAPLDKFNRSGPLKGLRSQILDADQDGDDESDALSPGLPSRNRRIRRNTHNALEVYTHKTGDTSLTRFSSRLNSDPIRRYHRPPRILENRLSEGHFTPYNPNSRLPTGCDDINQDVAHPSSSVHGPSIPDVIPRQLHSHQPVCASPPSASFHSPLLLVNPLTRQRSFSFPMTQSHRIWPFINAPNLQSDYALFDALPMSQRLSYLATRMAQIGDELNDEYSSANRIFQQFNLTRRTSRVLAFVCSLSSTVISVFTLALDLAYRIIHPPAPLESPTASPFIPIRHRRRTIAYCPSRPPISLHYERYRHVQPALPACDQSVRTSTPHEHRHFISSERQVRRRERFHHDEYNIE